MILFNVGYNQQRIKFIFSYHARPRMVIWAFTHSSRDEKVGNKKNEIGLNWNNFKTL